MSYLQNNLKEIMSWVENVNSNQIIFQSKLLDLYEGSIGKYLDEAIDASLDATAAKQSKKRKCTINILPQVIKKTSAVYTFGVQRKSNGNSVDDETMSYYENELAFDNIMNVANKYLSLFRHCALEPYMSKDGPAIRVLPPTQFTVWSNNPINPLEPTVFIKFIGQREALTPRTDSLGTNLTNPNNALYDVDIFHLYSDHEFLIVDSEWNVRYDLMGDNIDGINHFGVIPFIYLSKSQNHLIPLPNQDMFDQVLQPPILLTDLSFAILYQSFSTTYLIDIDAESLSGNPNSLWVLQGTDREGATPTVGTIKPEVDVEKVLNYVKDSLSLFFESLGMKSSGIGNISATSAQSGIAKAIDGADISEIRSEQKPIMKKAELQLWDLLKTMHTFWAVNGQLGDVKVFSDAFKPTITYNDPEPFVDYKVQIDAAALKYERGLTSFKRAVQEANQDLNAQEIEDLLEEIKAEKMENVSTALNSFPQEVVEEE